MIWNIPTSRNLKLEIRLALILMILLFPLAAGGTKKKSQPAHDLLADYLAQVRAATGSSPLMGNIWTPQSTYTDLASDYKARNVNDLIMIQVVESTTAAEDGAVKSQRTFSASSAITGLLGTPGPANSLQNIFAPNSSRTLNGQAQTSSDSSLTTSLSGRVVEVLPNGFLVLEAVREVEMNNQHQTLIVRGVVRPGDVTSSNTVPSTAISNLQVELKGHGVISDGVEPPNRLVRAILKIVGF
jgi:flagellar L-ring protein precursor FlgH